MLAFVTQHARRRLRINHINQQLIATAQTTQAMGKGDQSTSKDAHPYATLRKNLKAKRGTVHTSYLYEALATFVETGTTLLPPAATLIPGVGLATAPFSTSQNSSASGRRSADDGAAEPQDNLAQRATTTPPTSLLQAANNVVAAPHLTSNPHPHGSIIPVDYRDGDGSDPRPILLFDLNGTITSHTVKRRSSGINKPRPGIPHLRRLQPHFRLGVFTSSTWRTVQAAVAMLEKAAGPGSPLFAEPRLILHRGNAMQVPAHHITQGGKSWDTVKPLHPYFQRLHRVLLLDDDAFKALDGQRPNMVLIPVWQQHGDDGIVRILVDVLLEKVPVLGHQGDVRSVSQAVQEALWQRSGLTAADKARQAAVSEDASVAKDVVVIE